METHHVYDYVLSNADVLLSGHPLSLDPSKFDLSAAHPDLGSRASLMNRCLRRVAKVIPGLGWSNEMGLPVVLLADIDKFRQFTAKGGYSFAC